MHRVDHGGRGAGAAERVADVDDVGDAGAFAAELVRHHDAEQALGARRAIASPESALRGRPRRRARGDGSDHVGAPLRSGANVRDDAWARSGMSELLARRFQGCASDVH